MDIKDTSKKDYKKTKLIMPVHLYGNIFDTYELKKDKQKNTNTRRLCTHFSRNI